MRTNRNKFLLIILLFTLSFGFCAQSLAEKYSDLQTKTTQAAINRKKAIYPAKYGMDNESPTVKKAKKKKSFGTVMMEMVRALVLVLALFLGVAAYIAKHKDKFKNIELPNALKNVPVEEIKQDEPPQELDPHQRKIRDLVFKFFDINK